MKLQLKNIISVSVLEQIDSDRFNLLDDLYKKRGPILYIILEYGYFISYTDGEYYFLYNKNNKT